MEMVLDTCQAISDSPIAIPSNAIRGYRDLHVWRDSMDLVVEIYRLTAAFPGEGRGDRQHAGRLDPIPATAGCD